MISEILFEGIEKAQSGRSICRLLNISPRDLTQAIEDERRQGRPICATSNGTRPGYYLAATQEEMQNYCRRLNHRAGEIHKTRRACMKTIPNLPPSASSTAGGDHGENKSRQQ